MAESRLVESRLVALPLSRIRVIMKSSPDVSCINPDALILTAKATELFVTYLASYSYKHGTGKEDNTLAYDDLSNTAENSEIFGFLSDILPKKILASDYLKLLSKEEKDGTLDEAEEEEEEEEEEEDDDEEGDEEEQGEEEDEASVDSDDEADEDYEQDDDDDEEDD
ncbi:PREDICTED: chromatin accessibility complex protein 1 [Nanorana parkeri]|uniref:chromatin accessibility complex protein 1 n=1 Tax=Nanorana parkeri TaxID=125878 RepID=UPI000853F470|nr:PREDICTED: chromatin accessibility complex protein 1 [Nanorana parkeri]